MNNYDFKALDDKEFEVFCADLLSETEDVRFERFKRGRDKGPANPLNTVGFGRQSF